MATTTNGIYYPTSSDNIAPLESHFATMATSVDTAVRRIQSGRSSTFTVGTVVGNSNTTTITFSPAFSAAPFITGSVQMAAAGSAYSVSFHAVTGSSAVARVTRVAGTTSDGNLQVNWIARL